MKSNSWSRWMVGRDVRSPKIWRLIASSVTRSESTGRVAYLDRPQPKKTVVRWDAAEGFDHWAGDARDPLIRAPPWVISRPVASGSAVDDVIKQNGDVSQLIWSVPEVIAELSTLIELRAGDLIYTAAPPSAPALTRTTRHRRHRIPGLGELFRNDRLT
jgi:hypothetical protein